MMASFIYLQTAKIQYIFDLYTGVEICASKFVGNSDNALKLRTKLRKDIERGETRYVCPVCFQPIYLCSNPEKTGQYFSHRDTENNCPKLEKQKASQDVIRAIKYNGAKESQAHLETKRFLVDSLNADPLFSGAVEEKVWRSKTGDGKFRRPDVQAIYHGPSGDLRIAFEIQLSTTFLSEIVQRSEFYLNEDALLIWVFRRFVERGPKLTQLDIFYPNNLNAFVVNRKTRDVSVERKKFHLDCYWAEPFIANLEINQKINKSIVSFNELTLDQTNQQAYLFDYDSSACLLKNDVQLRKLQHNIQELKIHCRLRSWEYDDPVVNKLRSQFAEHGYNIPQATAKFHRLMKSILSVEEGAPVGFGFNNLVQVGHHLYDTSPDDLLYFLAASNAYNRKEELLSHKNAYKWKERKKEVWDELVNDEKSRFEWDTKFIQLVFLVFPEVKTEFHHIVNYIDQERKNRY